MIDMGVLTMKNYGLRRNCTTSIISPEQINLLSVDVGVSSEASVLEAEIGLTNQVSSVIIVVYIIREVKAKWLLSEAE